MTPCDNTTQILFFKFRDKPGGYFWHLNEKGHPDMTSWIDGRHDDAAADRYRRCLQGNYWGTEVEEGRIIRVYSDQLPRRCASMVNVNLVKIEDDPAR